jgi:hypothetical protein
MGGVSGVAFDLGQVADSSVQLPVDAISDPEILDEPGIAAAALSGTIYPITTTYSTLSSATATFPDRGYVVVIAEATFRADTLFNYLQCQLVDNSGQVAFWYWDPGDVDTYFDQRQTYVFTDSVTAGTNTYALQVSHNAGSCAATYPKVTVLYFPTAYGTVSSPLALGSDLNSPTAQRRPEAVASTPVDVAADRAASVEFNAERMRREMQDMKDRLAQLEAMLQAQTQTTAADR